MVKCAVPGCESEVWAKSDKGLCKFCHKTVTTMLWALPRIQMHQVPVPQRPPSIIVPGRVNVPFKVS